MIKVTANTSVITPEEVEKKILEAPFFTDYGLTPKKTSEFTDILYTILTSTIIDKDHIINKNTVTGIWYLTDIQDDENPDPEFIIRTSIKSTNGDDGTLAYELDNICSFTTYYGYCDEVLRDDTFFVEGVASKLREEIVRGNIVMIYDENRMEELKIRIGDSLKDMYVPLYISAIK